MINLTERIVYILLDHIRDNIEASLTDLRTDRADASVNTELPKTYFPYAPAQGFRCPTVSIIADNFDFKLDKGQNFIDGTLSAYCSVCIEDRTQEKLQKKAWRYQDALYKILNRQDFEGPNYKFIVTITGARYSGDAIMKADGITESVFRKEVALDLEIESYQQD